eukprot:gene8732-9623_t
MSDLSLVSLEPSGTLVLNLERGIQAKAILNVTNVSNSRIAFKVKTTQPSWYYVRPNQQILDVGKTEEVSIILIDTECNRYLDQLAMNQEEKTDKHRFLVQSKVIEDSVYERLSKLDPAARADELTKIWEGSKDDRKNIKLKVEFRHNGQATSSSSTRPTGDEDLRSSLARSNHTKDKGTTNATPEVVMTELQNMRKKYDAVVEYTVHLTAERDAIVAQLENLQREYKKEQVKIKGGAQKQASAGELDKKVDRGFSLVVVLLAAVLSFLFGKYFS